MSDLLPGAPLRCKFILQKLKSLKSEQKAVDIVSWIVAMMLHPVSASSARSFSPVPWKTAQIQWHSLQLAHYCPVAPWQTRAEWWGRRFAESGRRIEGLVLKQTNLDYSNPELDLPDWLRLQTETGYSFQQFVVSNWCMWRNKLTRATQEETSQLLLEALRVIHRLLSRMRHGFDRKKTPCSMLIPELVASTAL